MYGENSEEDVLSPNLDEMFGGNPYVNNNNKLLWQHPDVTVTSCSVHHADRDYVDDFADRDSPI